jgi:hypothetical protein
MARVVSGGEDLHRSGQLPALLPLRGRTGGFQLGRRWLVEDTVVNAADSGKYTFGYHNASHQGL